MGVNLVITFQKGINLVINLQKGGTREIKVKNRCFSVMMETLTQN